MAESFCAQIMFVTEIEGKKPLLLTKSDFGHMHSHDAEWSSKGQ